MEMFKNLINVLYDTKLNNYRKVLKPREFISAQLRLYENRLKLLAFLGRKAGSYIIVDSFEGIELKLINRSSSKVHLINVNETGEWNERTDYQGLGNKA